MELPLSQLQNIVERVVRSSLRRDNAASDVTQDVFVQILQSLDSVRDRERLEPWVATVAAFTVRRELRRRRRSIRLVWVQEPDADEQLSYSPDTDNRRVLLRLDAALAQLSADDRTLLLERASSPDSVLTLAAEFGCSVSTLRRRLARARRRLCQIMENDAELRHLSAAAFGSYPRAARVRGRSGEPSCAA
jgi:RNA polymerase sigma-70 factor (ECF subfamily)